MPPVFMLLVFAFTLFLSATLMFFVELMVGKMMLPLLGGTPAVWNTCMVFYQAVLLAGYAFAHWATQWLGARRQARLQLAVLVVPFIAIAINGLFYSGLLAPNANLIAGNEANPIPALLLVLTLSIGVPMFVISTSAPLLQRWFSSTDHPAARDPYFLYGASNFGSMLGLWGYIFLVEPYLTLQGQQIFWVAGFALLAISVVACAYLMWNARPAPILVLEAPTGDAAALTAPRPDAIRAAERGVVRKADRAPAVEEDNTGPVIRPVTWTRRLRWIALALVPSSLMLGATTYITTDIAAIPLLWVLPLTLYLVTFIVVFAHISPLTQSIVTLAGLGALMVVTIVWIAPLFILNDSVLWLVRLIGIGIMLFSLQLIRLRDTKLIHRVMIMVMPLLVLLLLFMMLSDIRPGVVANILLHLATLFIVAMVCHGELANDRPEPKHLTEFFLWMSFGGVVGGLFNGLFSPVAFNALVEYPLMMMIACLLLPPLGVGRSSVWARRADIALAAVFLLVGGLLLYLRYRDNIPDLDPVRKGPWRWGLAAMFLAGLLGVVAAWQRWAGQPPTVDDPEPEDHWLDRVLDVVLPATLLVLVLGLYWGLPAKHVEGRLHGFSKMVNLDIRQFRVILTFGLPAVLCYTFVERSVRFGLGVGAIMLAAGFSNIIDDSPLHQERSFFGVLRVETGAVNNSGYYYAYNRMVHGTTLHGKQFLEDGIRDIPVSYYHRSGPVGRVFLPYNTDPKRPIAVIGLGTGSMATYGLKGQTVDFFDIDPIVVNLSYDTEEYFTFVEDAEERGVNINLVLGDARLTFEPKGVKTRLKPRHCRVARKDKETGATIPAVRPERTYGEPLREDFKYGFIVVDAFSSDAIPVHLITKEAVKIYFDRLLDDGILMMHISNRYLDLQPVLANIADELGVVGYHMSDDDDRPLGKNRAHWVALARKKEHLTRLFEYPRWQTDSDQVSLLACALWPSAGPGLMSATGLCYAFQSLAEQQAQMAARQEGEKGDVARTRVEWEKDRHGDYQLKARWEPLDQPTRLESRPVESQAQLDEVARQLAELEKPLVKAREQYKEKEKPVKALTTQFEAAGKDIEKLMADIAVSTTADRTMLNHRLSDLEKKKAALERDRRKAQEKLDEAAEPKDWLESIERKLTLQKERLERLIERTQNRKETAKRVGVWTDDYSNILSVFSW